MNFIKRNRSKVLSIFSLLVVGCFLFLAAYSEKEKYILSDTSLSDGDTILSDWVSIGTSENVAIALQVSDSVNAKVEVFSRVGSGQRILILDSLGVDSVSGNARASTVGTTSGFDLRGYAASNPVAPNGDTNYLPGANYIQVKIRVGDVFAPGSPSNFAKVMLLSTD